MFLSQTNRKIAIMFASIFTFVVLILLASLVSGQNGSSLAVGIALPPASPMMMIGCLLAGLIAGKWRKSLLLALPISFSIGVVSGVMLQTNMEMNISAGMLLSVALLLWIACLWLLTNTQTTNICLVFLMLAMMLGNAQTLPADMQSTVMFTMLGMLLSTSLLFACGMCAFVATNKVDTAFPNFNMTELKKIYTQIQKELFRFINGRHMPILINHRM